MDDYSDDESLTEYTETKVLLGYAEEEAGSDIISHLGGKPVRSQTLRAILPPSSSPADGYVAVVDMAPPLIARRCSPRKMRKL
jgi:hypothetical protein